jgi:hypothetical protein
VYDATYERIVTVFNAAPLEQVREGEREAWAGNCFNVQLLYKWEATQLGRSDMRALTGLWW